MRQHRAKNHLPQMQGKLYCWRARDSAFQDSPKKQAPSPIEDAEEELEESPKPKKKKKKQSGSGSGLATWLSIKKIKKRRPYQNKKYRVVDLLLNQHCNFPKWRWSWLNK